MPIASPPLDLLVFGGGYLGRAAALEATRRGGRATATSRDPERRRALAADGIMAIDPSDTAALKTALEAATAVLITAAPDAQGCPGLRALGPLAGDAWPDWIGYVSSTSVYGDRAGGWVFEDGPLNAANLEGARRVRAERDWLDGAQGMGLTVQIFRLPGFYGPGRSVVERLREGTAKLVRKPGQVFNRIHVDDIVSGLFASMAQPRPGAAYNLTDDEPSPADVVMEWAADRMGLPRPPQVDWTDDSVSEAMRRFYLDSKRVSNALAKAELGWRLAYPTWREGLTAILDAPPPLRMVG
ncbi:SDR family NAD(P)-dependent oxidoreductase [uncultured Brevundimonas sp.]|uniref:SDR family NAD(P)-dependent oxidoreductase n=1 Tax=uncultured Brevundimonas sp. TaxID=213418 RepID=UPI0025D07B5A|nr:SDR family NAD(P)-dependent oxidoreductase [uncultured Brevundimonas sp.]